MVFSSTESRFWDARAGYDLEGVAGILFLPSSGDFWTFCYFCWLLSFFGRLALSRFIILTVELSSPVCLIYCIWDFFTGAGGIAFWMTGLGLALGDGLTSYILFWSTTIFGTSYTSKSLTLDFLVLTWLECWLEVMVLFNWIFSSCWRSSSSITMIGVDVMVCLCLFGLDGTFISSSIWSFIGIWMGLGSVLSDSSWRIRALFNLRELFDSWPLLN